MIKTMKTTSGLRIVHEEVPYANALSIGVWVKVGSNDERPEQAGLAHFIEHMLFKGTTTRSAKEIATVFDRMGGELNAFTSKESTCYHTTVLQEDAKEALQILADMMFHSTFLEEEIAREQDVILEEIAMYEDTPDDEVHELVWKTLYPNHPFGKPVLGTAEIVTSFTKQSIETFMETFYRPERIVISLAGAYDEAILQEVESLFSHERLHAELAALPLREPIAESGFMMVKKDIEQAHYCVGFPSVAIEDEAKYPLSIVDSIVGSSMSSRLFQEVREVRGLAYSIFSYYTAYERGGAFMIYGGTSAEKLSALQETIFDVLRTLIQDGVTAAEVAQAKTAVKNSFLLGLDGTEARMSRNGHQTLILNEQIDAETICKKLEQITVDEINELMPKIFTNNFARAVILPEDAPSFDETAPSLKTRQTV